MPRDKRPNFRPGFKSPKWDQHPDSAMKYLALTGLVVFLLLIGLVGYCATPVQSQEGVVVHIKNFGKAMAPGLPPYRNDPEGIVLSQNMISLMLGSRELRSGYSELVDTDTLNFTVTATDPIDAFATFSPVGDSGSMVIAAGGHWYTFTSSYISWLDKNGRVQFVTPDTTVEIRPYSQGTLSVDTTTLQVLGVGTRFVRDLQPGDSIFSSDTTNRFKVSHIVDDTVLYIDTTAAEDSTISDSYTARRGYTDSASVKPYLHSSQGLLYTGTNLDPSQVIYNYDSVLYMREMGIVDSFLIDTVYTLYPRRVSAADSSDTADYLRWDSTSVYPRRSWDTTVYNDSGHTSFYSREFMLVNRRVTGQWAADQWAEDLTENPEAYYVRLGVATSPNTGTFFRIRGNDDTAMFLQAWYVDSTAIVTDSAGSDRKSWNDSIFGGHGADMNDTLKAADVEGKWAYIYSAAGFNDVIVDDQATGVVTIQGRGAMFYTIDASFPIDTTEVFKGMHFIHLTGSDIEFLADTNTQFRTKNQDDIYSEFEDLTFPDTDSLLSKDQAWRCKEGGGRKWHDTYEAAIEACGAGGDGRNIIQGWRYKVATLNKNQIVEADKAIGKAYFHIRYMRKAGDTVFFITDVYEGLTSILTDTTSNWEIVRTNLPNWSGMTEWGTPPQLVAWGDTLSPALLSFSGFNDPWNWSANRDILIGSDTRKPVVGVAGFDKQLVAFQPSEMWAYNGSVLEQISASDGLVSANTIVKREKEMYWADVDGPKRIKLQDFRGYSIEKLGQGMDPVFNAWSSSIYGGNIVPVTISPQYRYKSLMAWDKRNNHLLYAFTSAGQTDNDKIAAFDLKSNQWDGIFTIATSTLGAFNINDTLRVVFTDDDSSKIFKTDYAFDDNGVGIDGQLRSSPFYLTDENGFPVKSKIGMIQLVYRGSSAIDSLAVNLIGDVTTTTFTITAHTSFKTYTAIQRPSTENVSMYWQWDIIANGKAAGGAFIPHDLYIQLLPVERND